MKKETVSELEIIQRYYQLKHKLGIDENLMEEICSSSYMMKERPKFYSDFLVEHTIRIKTTMRKIADVIGLYGLIECICEQTDINKHYKTREKIDDPFAFINRRYFIKNNKELTNKLIIMFHDAGENLTNTFKILGVSKAIIKDVISNELLARNTETELLKTSNDDIEEQKEME